MFNLTIPAQVREEKKKRRKRRKKKEKSARFTWMGCTYCSAARTISFFLLSVSDLQQKATGEMRESAGCAGCRQGEEGEVDGGGVKQTLAFGVAV